MARQREGEGVEDERVDEETSKSLDILLHLRMDTGKDLDVSQHGTTVMIQGNLLSKNKSTKSKLG